MIAIRGILCYKCFIKANLLDVLPYWTNYLYTAPDINGLFSWDWSEEESKGKSSLWTVVSIESFWLLISKDDRSFADLLDSKLILKFSTFYFLEAINSIRDCRELNWSIFGLFWEFMGDKDYEFDLSELKIAI